MCISVLCVTGKRCGSLQLESASLSNKSSQNNSHQTLMDPESSGVVSDATYETELVTDKPLSSTETSGALPFIHRLPEELLAEVYLLCMGPEDELHQRQFCIQTRTLLMQVCRRWRDITIRTSKLWSVIYLYLTQIDPPSQVALLESWIARSGAQPLNLQIEAPFFEDETHGLGRDGETHPAIIALGAVAMRWRKVNFRITSGMYHQFSPFDLHLPLLRKLELRRCTHRGIVYDYEYHDARWYEPIKHAFRNAPLLTDITIGRCFPSGIFQFPWDQVTNIDMDSTTYVDVAKILPEWSNLTTCRLSMLPYPIIPAVAITLPHLRSLSIFVDHNPNSFFEQLQLTLPSLREFAYTDTRNRMPDMPWPARNFIDLLRRSSCPLQKLKLVSGCEFVGPQLVELLLLVPDLTTLVIAGNDTSLRDAIWKMTCDTPSSRLPSCLVPKLQTLDVSIHKPINEGPFVDMVESRFNSGLPLDMMTIRIDDSYIEEYYVSHVVFDPNMLQRWLFTDVHRRRLKRIADKGSGIRYTASKDEISLTRVA